MLAFVSKRVRGNFDAEDSEVEDTLATLKAVAVSFSIGEPRETIEELTKMLYWGSRTQETKRPFSNLQPENVGELHQGRFFVREIRDRLTDKCC